MKKRKGLLFAIVFGLVLITDFYLFGLSIAAFGWHLRHGFHREVYGFMFKVPLFYEESDHRTVNAISIYSFPSPIHRESSSISVQFPPGSAKKPLVALTEQQAQRIGLGFLGERSARLAGRTGKCIEYAQQETRTQSAILAHLQPMRITCQFGDVDATFDGTRNAVPEFYEFLESAGEVKR
ncbi:MAG TPA: hypothetical protein VHA06_22820 [Candidatus Angelobacter sp.]|nr:hypothetical protein [Candidatus Angelobacter sp.]